MEFFQGVLSRGRSAGQQGGASALPSRPPPAGCCAGAPLRTQWCGTASSSWSACSPPRGRGALRSCRWSPRTWAGEPRRPGAGAAGREAGASHLQRTVAHFTSALGLPCCLPSPGWPSLLWLPRCGSSTSSSTPSWCNSRWEPCRPQWSWATWWVGRAALRRSAQVGHQAPPHRTSHGITPLFPPALRAGRAAGAGWGRRAGAVVDAGPRGAD